MKRILCFILIGVCIILPWKAYAQLQLDKMDVKLNITGGQIVNGSVIVSNTSTKNITVRAYPEDFTYSFPFDGRKTPFPLGSVSRSCGKWISVSSKSFVLPPHGKKEVNYSVKVPNDVKGNYWGVLILEQVPNKFTGNLGVSLILRIGCSFLLEASGSEKKAVLEDITISSGNIQGNFLNNGNVILTAKGIFYVMDSSKKVLNRGDIAKYVVSPDEKASFTINLSKNIPQGSYTLFLNFTFEGGGSLEEELNLSKDEAGNITILNIKD